MTENARDIELARKISEQGHWDNFTISPEFFGRLVAVIESLRAELLEKEQERAYAWKNVHILEQARQEQDDQIQQLQAEVERLNACQLGEWKQYATEKPKSSDWYMVRYFGDAPFAMFFRADTPPVHESQWYKTIDAGWRWGGREPDEWLFLINKPSEVVSNEG